MFSNTESVRDVQFCPQQPYTFAAVSENGHVQQWDMRKPDRYFQHFTAHSGPIFACDWHPEATWLATASRDKTIKVYYFIHYILYIYFIFLTYKLYKILILYIYILCVYSIGLGSVR